ncbi:MAG: helix-turn-helix domain-containing protein [Micromonosporaceae bacterium]|nr:helix-turn-helix domain-containing protein [Micromonosporaceae bacterium]
MDELPIGRRVAYWRGRRRMSQQVFADRLGKSKSWVDKVERGVRRLDKFSVIHDIADVLQVDAQLLLGHEPEPRNGGGSGVGRSEIAEIRAALERYDQVSAFFHQPPQPPDLAEVRKAVRHAWLTYQHAKGTALARSLPDLLRAAQAADAAYHGSELATESANLLGQVYQIASSSLRNLGELELSWLAADRAVTVAQRAGDELLAGVATFRVGMALLAMGRARPALEINVSVANRLAPACAGDARPGQLSVYGMLLLQGAMSAAKLGDSTTTQDLLSAAEDAAKLLGTDGNYYWSSFGPTNVLLHRVAAAVEMGEGRYAVTTHEQIGADGFAALVPERRVHHLLDMARGWAQVGDVHRAGEMLVAGDRLAPTELRSRPIAREILGDVLRRTHGEPPPAVCELAEQVGVGG